MGDTKAEDNDEECKTSSLTGTTGLTVSRSDGRVEEERPSCQVSPVDSEARKPSYGVAEMACITSKALPRLHAGETGLGQVAWLFKEAFF